MLIKTRGIVFKTIKYSETSLILDIYTEEVGLQKYIISGVRNKRSKLKAGLLQVATLIEMVAYHRKNKAINRIKEIKAARIYRSIPFDVVKGTVSLFMIELAQKTIKEEAANKPLFEFLFEQFSCLDEVELNPSFHLQYMLSLSGFLGFMPGGEWTEDTPWFDMKEGVFVREEPLHQYAMDKLLSEKVGIFLKGQASKLNRLERQALVEKLITYYRIQIENFNGLNTHNILKEVF